MAQGGFQGLYRKADRIERTKILEEGRRGDKREEKIVANSENPPHKTSPNRKGFR